MNKKELGLLGERLAAKYLIEQGYKYQTRHYQKQIGEIDLVFKQGNDVIFIEVKTRTNENYGEGFESVDFRKIKKMIKAGEFYCLENKLNFDNVRFDVISIFMNKDGKTCKIKHLKKVI